MEILYTMDGRIVCSAAEARKWEDDEHMPNLTAPGDTVIRFRGDGTPEVGIIGVKAAMAEADNTQVLDKE